MALFFYKKLTIDKGHKKCIIDLDGTHEKDVFNGKILHEFSGLMKFTLLITAIVFVVCGVFFLLMAIFYENMEYAAQVFLFCASAVSILAAIAYPLISLHLIRTFPKHKKLAKLFVKEYVFVKCDQTTQQNNCKD